MTPVKLAGMRGPGMAGPDWPVRPVSADEVHSVARTLARAFYDYLPFVGVIPEAQGRGLGTALVRPILEKCDREQIPAYLEATSTSSRRCYERIGFEVRAEERLPGDGPPFWPMWRPPAS